MRFKKALGILRTKIRLLLMIGGLLAAAAGCQFAGEYLHSHYIREEASETSGNISEKKTVVIDSGHGGKDPGKVGINGAQEKELNLQIAEKLKKYLEEHQITVVMTRTKDERLADSQVEDLKARVELIDKESPALAVCIHQNSYPQESVRGPQIFYFAHSKEAKKAAEVMQTELKKIQKEVGITFIFVTHDQEEALSILYAEKYKVTNCDRRMWIFKQPGGGRDVDR